VKNSFTETFDPGAPSGGTAIRSAHSEGTSSSRESSDSASSCLPTSVARDATTEQPEHHVFERTDSQTVNSTTSDSAASEQPSPLALSAIAPSGYGNARGCKSLEAWSGKEDASLNGLPSIGSKLHSSGQCQLCFFFLNDAGCRKGVNCNFCHMRDHAIARSMSRRPSKAVRAGYRSATMDIVASSQTPRSKLAALTKLAEAAGNNLCIIICVKLAREEIAAQSKASPSEFSGTKIAL